MIEREIVKKIKEKIASNKILVLIGTSENIQENLFDQQVENYKLFDISNKKTKKTFQYIDRDNLNTFFEGKKNVILKEAQLLDNLQQIIEIVLFENLEVNLICLCSFEPVFDDILLEVLTAQELIIKTTSPTFKDIAKHFGLIQIEKNLEQRLIFGNNQEVFESTENAILFLENCVSNILKSTLNPKERINKTEQLRKLLQNIALSIGKHVSYNELGTKVGLDNETVERYILLLEKAQVLIKIPTYSTDQKYELKKTHCIYFYDNGVRNALIKNYNELEFRSDADILWKNWFIAEKYKKSISEIANFYFWVTHTKQQVDLIEIKPKDNKMFAYQMKWDKKDKKKFPKSFSTLYPNVKLIEINRSTYWSFLAKD
ncbi:MAG: DUF4143 domain-containing protein [Bacteroidota bacterium]